MLEIRPCIVKIFIACLYMFIIYLRFIVALKIFIAAFFFAKAWMFQVWKKKKKTRKSICVSLDSLFFYKRKEVLMYYNVYTQEAKLR